MINLENSRELRIKRANTDWWINEKAIVADNGLTYIAYITDMGEIHIKELDAKCSKTPSRDYRLCTLNCAYADEHNAPSLCILKNGKLIVAYTGHGSNYELRYRITERPYDISSFGEEICVPYEGKVTYVQIFENIKKKEIWLFTRVSGYTWEFRYSKDEAVSWSVPKKFLISKSRGLFYFDVRKQFVPTSGGMEEQWFFALYGHPTSSKDHTIRSGIFNSDGQWLKTDGSVMDMNLYIVDERQLELELLDTVYDSPEGTTVRLLDVAPTLPLRVAFGTFDPCNLEAPDPEKVVYRAATFRDGKWGLSEPICKAGEFLAQNIQDGSQTYLGGMAYYYGVGAAGVSKKLKWGHPKYDTDRIYLVRFDGVSRVLEAYISRNLGDSYECEQVIRRIPAEREIKMWRPIVPIHAQDNMPLYWHEGSYSTFEGGWHCDAVMYVEYDD